MNQESSWSKSRTKKFSCFTYEPGKGCGPVRDDASSKVLGKIPDGWWDVEVIKVTPIGGAGYRPTYEIILRHNRMIHVELSDQSAISILREATGFSRPQGGHGVVRLRDGKLVGCLPAKETT